jgi:hypothetical protein
VGLLPPDIDTKRRIDTKKAGVTPAFSCSDAGAAALGAPCRVQFEYAKKIFRAARNFSS